MLIVESGPFGRRFRMLETMRQFAAELLHTFASGLAERYRTQGPPTYLHWSLGMLGFSALFQGRPDLADRYFDESAGVHVPDRTISANQPIAARAAFRKGTGSGRSGSSSPTSTTCCRPTTWTSPGSPASSSST
jgi:hypothetical protein